MYKPILDQSSHLCWMIDPLNESLVKDVKYLLSVIFFTQIHWGVADNKSKQVRAQSLLTDRPKIQMFLVCWFALIQRLIQYFSYKVTWQLSSFQMYTCCLATNAMVIWVFYVPSLPRQWHRDVRRRLEPPCHRFVF